MTFYTTKILTLLALRPHLLTLTCEYKLRAQHKPIKLHRPVSDITSRSLIIHFSLEHHLIHASSISELPNEISDEEKISVCVFSLQLHTINIPNFIIGYWGISCISVSTFVRCTIFEIIHKLSAAPRQENRPPHPHNPPTMFSKEMTDPYTSDQAGKRTCPCSLVISY